MELVSAMCISLKLSKQNEMSFVTHHQLHRSHKYLVNGQGRAIKSYGHRVQPMDIEADIVALLDENEKQKKMQVPQTY